ncbi:hypothetical protein [Streptomyces achromogenes]
MLYIVQGLSLVSRAGLDRTAALAAIDTALDGLRARPAQRRERPGP